MKSKTLIITGTVIGAPIIFILGRMSANSGSAHISRNILSESMSRENSSGNSDQYTSSTRKNSARTTDGVPMRYSIQNKDAMAKRIKDIAGIEDANERMRTWLHLIESLSPDQYEPFMDFLIDYQLSDIGRAHEVARVSEENPYFMCLNQWAKTDPIAALAFLPKRPSSTIDIHEVLSAWAQYDTNSALQWVNDNHQGEEVNPWVGGVIKGIAGQNLERATDLLATMPDTPERGLAIRYILPTVMSQGIAEARDWASRIKDAGLREQAINEIEHVDF